MWSTTFLTSNIIKEVDQIAIWSFIFGYNIVPHKKYRNPFRIDNNPGCWIEEINGVYKLRDYACREFHNIDIISGIRLKLNLDYQAALNKILEIHIEDGEKVEHKSGIYKKFNFILEIKPKEFTQEDLEYWSLRKVTKSQLEEDGIVSVETYRCNSKNEPNILFYFYPKLAFCAFFPSGNKKITLPNTPIRFLTNCNQEDIGGIWNQGKQIVITKSYKDYRAIKNMGYNVLYTMNEGCFPSILKEIIVFFEDVVIFYDNDKAGIKAANKLREFLERGRIVYIKNKKYKDSDELMVDNQEHLIIETIDV